MKYQTEVSGISAAPKDCLLAAWLQPDHLVVLAGAFRALGGCLLPLAKAVLTFASALPS